MKGRVTKTGYRRNSPDVNNDYNVIPSNRISMSGVDFPVLGVDNLGNSELMYPGGEYEFQGDYVTELPAYGSGGLTQWFAEKWVDIKTGKECGRSGKDKNGRPYPACRPSKRVNSTTPKTKDEMSASEKAKFKKSKTSGKRINYNHKRAQEGTEVPLNRSEVFNIPRTVRYENNKMVLQDKPVWDGMLDEVTITPYTQSELAFQERMADKATGAIEPVYPLFEIMTAGLKAPATAGAKAIEKSIKKTIKKAPSKLNPNYYNPNLLAKGNPSVYYRKAGKDAYEDFVNSGFLRTRAEVTDKPVMGLLATKREMDQVRKSIKEYGQFTYRHPSAFRAPYFSRGRTADIIASDKYLFQTRPGLIGDDAFTSGQMNVLHGKGKSPVSEGGFGIMDPMYRSADNFDVFKKSWWHGYKPVKKYGGSLPKAQKGNSEVALNRGEIFNIPRTMGYEDGKMVVQDKPIWDGFLDEVTVTPYTQNQIASEYMMNNKATGGLEPVYPVFDLMTLGLKAPATAGARAIQAGIKKAPSKINPRYFQPNSNMYYRGIGRQGMEDALESGLFRAKPSDKIPARMVDLGPNLGKLDMAKRFNKTYYSPRFNIADQYGAGYIAEVPKDAAKFSKRYKNTDWSMSTRDQIPVSEGRILEKNWWSGYKPVKAYGGSLPKAQKGVEVIERNGVRKNEDGSVSTHLMAREYVDGRGWVAFPTLFQNSDSTWVDMSKDSSWYPAYEEAVKRGEVYDFGEDVEAAINFSDKGSWKKQQGGQQGPPYLTPGPIQDKVYPMVTGPAEDNLENRIINAKSSAPKGFSRRDALLNASKRVSEGQGGRPLEVLLNMTAFMENSLGNDPKAYGRDYTRSQMSIDDNAYADLFEPRGEYDYTSSQKKGFEWLKGMGYEPTKMDSILRTDDPVAAMATARLVYGRAPGALPNPDNPKEVYGYYMDNYNKSGALKYGNDQEHYKRFLDAYNDLYQKEQGGEQIPSFDIYDTYQRAWLAARKKLGVNKKFMYKGLEESTNT